MKKYPTVSGELEGYEPGTGPWSATPRGKQKKCEQCGEHVPSGARFCDENCWECWKSEQYDAEQATARAERDGRDESYLDAGAKEAEREAFD